MTETGWFERQAKLAQESIEQWPQWVKDAMNIDSKNTTEIEKEAELENCPCCRSGAIYSDLSGYAVVSCIYCHLRTRDFYTKKEAITAWNTRAPTARERELEEALKHYATKGEYYSGQGDVARAAMKK